jgi:hypothetical protein
MLALSTNPLRGSPVQVALLLNTLLEYLKSLPSGRYSIVYKRKHLPAQLAEVWDILQQHPAGVFEDLKILETKDGMRLDYQSDDCKYAILYGEKVTVLKR